MTISEELATVLKQVCKDVDSWEPWQRSRDPQGSEEAAPRVCTTADNARTSRDQQATQAVLA
jgi:hypothetical protein